MALQHSVFQTPYPVEPTFVETATPENYRSYPAGVNLPAKIKTWKVQTKDYPEIDVGLVSSPSGFDDPDAEVISRGLNSKGPESVAIARHGNFLMWGFFAQPDHMTEEARKVFANTVVYINRFDGKRPIAGRQNMSRSDLAQYFVWARNAPAILRRTFGSDLVEQFKNDVDALEQHVQENLGYMHAVSAREVRIDADAYAVGIANNDPALLEHCINHFESTNADKAARAKRLLTRYTNESFDTTAEWEQWLKDNRDRMFFSDVGGFKWYVMD